MKQPRRSSGKAAQCPYVKTEVILKSESIYMMYENIHMELGSLQILSLLNHCTRGNFYRWSSYQQIDYPTEEANKEEEANHTGDSCGERGERGEKREERGEERRERTAHR